MNSFSSVHVVNLAPKMGTLVRYYSPNPEHSGFRLGLVIHTRSEQVVLFKDGSFVPLSPANQRQVEMICGTYLVADRIESLSEMTTLYHQGWFEQVFRSIQC